MWASWSLWREAALLFCGIVLSAGCFGPLAYSGFYSVIGDVGLLEYDETIGDRIFNAVDAAFGGSKSSAILGWIHPENDLKSRNPFLFVSKC